MNQRFTTRFSNLSGAWQFDDVPLDASTPDSGSVQSTFGLCMELRLCSLIPELLLAPYTAGPVVRGTVVRGPEVGLESAECRGPRIPDSRIPANEEEPSPYCRKRFPTELFGTIPRSMRR